MEMQFRNTILVSICLLGVVVWACGGDSPTTPTPQPSVGAAVIRLTVNSPDRLEPGSSVQLTAIATKNDASTEDVTARASWRSSDSSIVQVSASGMATALANGRTTISASYQTRGVSKTILSLPNNTYVLSGRVTESNVPLNGVSLTVVGGTGQGLSTATDGSGGFSLFGVAGTVRLNLRKDGYFEKTEQIEVGADLTRDFEMAPQRARRDLSGTYALTISAAEMSRCVTGANPLPEDLRTRSYTARLTHTGPHLSVVLSGADLVNNGEFGDKFTGTMGVSDDVTFAIGYYYYYYYLTDGITERITDTEYLVISGIVSAQATAGSISGTMTGSFARVNRSGQFLRTFYDCSGPSIAFDMRRQ